jgi:hypothetical protein
MKNLKTIESVSSTNLDNLIDKSNSFLQISTRTGSYNSLGELKIYNEEKLKTLAEKMPEINRATNSFGRTNSQTSDKLQSLTMISYSPYRYLHQCLAKIESRRQALTENQFKLKRSVVELEELKLEKEKLHARFLNLPSGDNELKTIELTIRRLNIDIEEKVVSVNDSMLYIEGALKEINIYQDSYEQIKKNHNIPDNWDEEDFENSELEHHIKMAFLNGVRDVISSGRLNMGTLEYFQQFGINPITANTLINSYVKDSVTMIEENKYPNINQLDEFLTKMFNIFKDSHKEQLKIIGLDNLVTQDALYLEN